MNVVHVFPYTPKLSGGHSNAIRSFIACHRAAGINAVGIAPAEDERPGPKDWEFPLAEVTSLWAVRWETLARRFGFAAGKTLLNFHSINHRLGPLMADLRRVGVPYVLTGHGQLSFQNPARWLKKFVYLNLVDRGPRKAAGLHVLSKLVASRLNYLLPGYRGALLVQGNLIKAPEPARVPAVTRSDYGLPSEAFVLLFLGRLDVWTKGLDVLVEALARLPASRFQLVMVGPDWEGGKAKLEKLAIRLGCRSRLHFLGPVYGEKKWSLFRIADTFVSPSRREAFSIAQAEAEGFGLPVVTSTKMNLAPELREACAALVVPPAPAPLAQAIASLAADPELRQTLAARGKAWVEKHCDPENAGPRFREFYQSILDRQGGAHG